MTHKYLVGDITYQRDDVAEQGWFYRLKAQFTSEAQQHITIQDAVRLQQQYGNDLDLKCSRGGIESMELRVVCHGGESAWQHADKLGTAIFRGCGVLMGISPA